MTEVRPSATVRRAVADTYSAPPPLPDFSDVFEAIHGFQPYPWQRRLADHVQREGAWPATIGVPTGTGKTATLDVALYALASDAGLTPAARRAPRRIVMVVDRRTIVDQSFSHAQRIRRALMTATTGPLVPMRQRLLALMHRDADEQEPLQLALLRGGVPRDDGWARRPDQALIAVSTVDQVGSRLLFRGYGVRPTMQSVHAGLLGHDTLFLLDEVHLARPFQETLLAMQRRWRGWQEVPLPDRWQFVSLSATSGAEAPFRLGAEDRALPRLRQRLDASKPVNLTACASKTHDAKGRPHKRWIAAVASSVDAHLKAGARCVGVVVNRVDTARAVAGHLRRAKRSDVQLVTGRMRGVDRATAAIALAERAGPDWQQRSGAQRPFVCVATQCIEAGADLDFDALTTEVASLDALVQRIGRANRTGAHATAPVQILAPSDVDNGDDPVYGDAMVHAWRWLGAQTALDAAPAALEPLLASAPRAALAPHECAAVILPAHLDLLSQTAPVPRPDPDPALYLHGLAPPRPEVQVIWRADVALDRPDAAAERLAVVPPTAAEALALPIAAARQWLTGQQVASFSDTGRQDAGEAPPHRGDQEAPVAFAWDGEAVQAVTARQIRPAQTLIVPAGSGGILDGSFNPTADGDDVRVQDVGDLARTIRTGRPHLRLDLRVHGSPDHSGWPDGMPSPPPLPDGEARTLQQGRAEALTWLSEVSAPADTQLGTLLALLQRTGARASTVDGCWVLVGRQRLPTDDVLRLARGETTPPGDLATTADDTSVVAARPVSLDVHLRGVAAWARDLAAACGLPDELEADLALAGSWHDLGKAHPRFQVLLHDGDEIRAAGAAPLAKSGMGLADRGARARARERAGLPRGFRHEMVSVSLLTTSEAGRGLLALAHDPDLVLHLVASHHGHARPFAPAEDHAGIAPTPGVALEHAGVRLTAPGDHALDRVDSGVAARFWRLQRRYGWWGLAWLEAILRLADHRESESYERPEEAK